MTTTRPHTNRDDVSPMTATSDDLTALPPEVREKVEEYERNRIAIVCDPVNEYRDRAAITALLTALYAKQREADKWYAVAVELATRIDRTFLSDHMGFDPPTVARALDEEVYRTIAEAEIAWEEMHRDD